MPSGYVPYPVTPAPSEFTAVINASSDNISLTVLNQNPDFGQTIMSIAYDTPIARPPKAFGRYINQVRPITLPCLVKGSSKDDLITQLRAISRAVSKAGTITITPLNATTSVVLKFYGGSSPIAAMDSLFEIGNVAVISIVLDCEPYLYGTEQLAIIEVRETTPTAIALSMIKGDYPTPLDISLTGTIHSAYAAVLDTTWVDWLVEAEDLNWSGIAGEAGVLTGYHGENGVIISTAGAGAAVIDDTAFPASPYLILSRLLGTTTVDSLQVASETAVSPESASCLHYTEAATLALPSKKVSASGVSSLPLSLEVPGSSVIVLDDLLFLPLFQGWAKWHHATPTTETTKIEFGYDGTVYVADVADATYGRGTPLLATKDSILYLVGESGSMSAADNSGGTLQMMTTVKYIPRYALWSDE